MNWIPKPLLFLCALLCGSLLGCGGVSLKVSPRGTSGTAQTAPGTRHPINPKSHADNKKVVQGPPRIHLNKPKDVTKATIEVVHLKPEDLAVLTKADWKHDRWAALFGVYVDEGTGAQYANQPAMLGSYKVEGKVLRFTPRFPLQPGVKYRAVLNAAAFSELSGPKKAIVANIVIPKPRAPGQTFVARVYPSASTLPENQLKFYVHFSAPMSKGEAYRHIHLLQATGTEVELPFLELDEELWDPEGQRFTLLFDPGRIKRGLKPREEVGPSLVQGKSYTLVIDQNWNDAQGEPLKEAHRKTFKVGPPDDTPPSPKTWKLHAPVAGSTEPLTLTFPKSMDQAMLEHALWIVGPGDQRVQGAISVTVEETCWQLTPREAWQAGKYALVVDKSLEDLAGNSIDRPFEVDVLQPPQRKLTVETISLPFEVKRPTQ
jgi:hypothetical protein